MKHGLTRILFSAALLSIVLLCSPSGVRAQFSKPVVVMKGSVMTTDGKPAVVRVSIHETGGTEDENDTSSDVITCGIQEITAGRANSESGRYLLVLKPAKKYWVHIEGTFIQSIDSLIATPKTDKSLQLERNFTVGWKSAPEASNPEAAPAKKD
ncbi:MAG: hypothetical protein Q8922_01150 [Bacteroidota bacterium]|nr:hypothetical protein [Bacteroidota bacterium]MDP4232166.1 hypothetical protein [Bacteroidota bacterium]MDP4241126.1 hypothetical protein [Bacteroidota bacterium]MDP4286518.1 hypothetical protein [Bacteroidota bacterium]